MGAADEQVEFLLSCIRHSTMGKIQWESVASECNIVSKGAAAKRFERICKANGVPNGSTGRTQSPVKRGAGAGGSEEGPETPSKKKRNAVKKEDELE